MIDLTIKELKSLIATLPDDAKFSVVSPRDIEYYIDNIRLSYVKPFDSSKREFVSTKVKFVVTVK